MAGAVCRYCHLYIKYTPSDGICACSESVFICVLRKHIIYISCIYVAKVCVCVCELNALGVSGHASSVRASLTEWSP